MFSRFKNYVSQQVEVLKTGQAQAPPTKGEKDDSGEKEPAAKPAEPAAPQDTPSAVMTAPVSATAEGSAGTPPALVDLGPVAVQKKEQQKSASGTVGLSSSLLSFFTVSKGFENAEYDIPEKYWKEGVEMNAGFTFVRRYEDAWNTLHEKNIDLGRSAERTDRQLKSAVQQANKHHTAISQLERQLSQLPQLIERMNAAALAVEAIEEQFKRLEDMYVTTVQKKKTQLFVAHQKKRKEELFQYEHSKRDELVKIDHKLKILKDHVLREEELELQRAEQEKKRLAAIAAQKEKDEYEAAQAVLQNKFLEDLEAFKSGALKERPVEPAPTSFADVSVDQGANDDLLSFLGGDDEEDEDNSADLTSMKLSEDDIGPSGVEVLPIEEEPAVEYVPVADIVAVVATEEAKDAGEHEAAQETVDAMESTADAEVSLASPAPVEEAEESAGEVEEDTNMVAEEGVEASADGMDDASGDDIGADEPEATADVQSAEEAVDAVEEAAEAVEEAVETTEEAVETVEVVEAEEAAKAVEEVAAAPEQAVEANEEDNEVANAAEEGNEASEEELAEEDEEEVAEAAEAKESPAVDEVVEPEGEANLDAVETSDCTDAPASDGTE